MKRRRGPDKGRRRRTVYGLELVKDADNFGYVAPSVPGLVFQRSRVHGFRWWVWAKGGWQAGTAQRTLADAVLSYKAEANAPAEDPHR